MSTLESRVGPDRRASLHQAPHPRGEAFPEHRRHPHGRSTATCAAFFHNRLDEDDLRGLARVWSRLDPDGDAGGDADRPSTLER
ncbi:hypothetical protein [Nonomuraea salmonea]|uniref:hypothetical protein n=1 Tax=Nonomuraea salmonea TaxID=46181 RepID=UPI0031EC9DEE